jgi:methionyl-tRNA formyltransferase
MTQKLDAGPIYDQKEFSLEGELQEILGVVKGLGFHMTVKLLNNWPVEPKEQNGSLATYCKRRTPEQSEITLEELKNESAETLYNKIRSLQTPYPRPYIVCGNGKKLYITGAIIDEY